MPFTVSRNLSSKLVYPEIGVTMPESKSTLDVTYTGDQVTSLTASEATVLFSVSVPGCETTGMVPHTFDYAGGNPLDEAENALKALAG